MLEPHLPCALSRQIEATPSRGILGATVRRLAHMPGARTGGIDVQTGKLALLLRKALAAWLFGAAILGMVGTSFYNFVLSDGTAVMGEGAVTFSVVIWVIALFLYFYAVAMAKRRVLR